MKTKQEEIDDPNSCWNKAKLDEPVFVLLGRDKSAPATIIDWCNRRVDTGKNSEDDVQIEIAYELADTMVQYRRKLDE